jgi:hypothetical protein
MSFDLNSSFDLHAEENLHVNENNSKEFKNFELLKILKPNFQNDLDFPELCEIGIELSDILKKDSSPDETEGNFILKFLFLNLN